MESKKGMAMGYDWIVGFFLVLLLFFLAIGLTDIAKVELFEPASSLIRANTIDLVGNDSVYVQKQNAIHNITDNVTLPYNLILMFITAYVMGMSIWDVMQREKQGFFSLLLGTIGGIVFLIYIFHLFVIGMIDWFQVEIIGKLFGDLIANEAPFYNTLLDNWWFIFIWALVLAGANRLFGKEPSEEYF